MVMLDVQKAFDSVDHEMLCEKIKLAGIDPEWFRSYLHGRKQCVAVSNNVSSEQTIKCGVPQGSILGPWCYLMFSNDISSSVSCKLIMYADDTVLLVSGKDVKSVASELSVEVGNCYHWLTNNRLSMHMGKTEAMVFVSKRKKHLINDFVIKYQGHNIQASDKIKYLGLYLDPYLSCEHVVNSIVSKCNSRLKFMYRYSKALNERSRKLITSALIQCHFDYAASAWYMGLNQSLKHRLQVAQNKMVRFILDMGPREHVGQAELNQAGMLKTGDRVKQLMLNHMHSVYNNSAPGYLYDHFTRVQDQHQYETRNAASNFVVPKIQGVAKNNFNYWGVKFWSELPTQIKGILNRQSYKNAVKEFLKNRAINMEQSSVIYY